MRPPPYNIANHKIYFKYFIGGMLLYPFRKMHSGYGTIFTYFIPWNSDDESWGMYHGFWDMLCMMFIGMALYGWGYFSNKFSTSDYTVGLLIGYGIGIPLGLIMFYKGQILALMLTDTVCHFGY